MSGIQCEKCQGTGLSVREYQDANETLHPVLSKCQGLCTHCGGSGVKPPKDAHAANREAAKQVEG